MADARLVQGEFLDPRPAVDATAAPIANAVNIPFAELPGRTHELPPRETTIAVVGPDALAQRVVSWLISNDRRACVQPDYRPSIHELPRARLWRPNAFLEVVLNQLLPGRALDLACGTGRDAVFMASRGWEVTGVDVLPDALERARELAARYLPGAPAICWMTADLERAVPSFADRFDLIIVFRYLHRPLLRSVRGWLRQGGSLVCETFTTVHRARHGRPARAAHALQPDELRALVTGLTVLDYSEAWRGAAHTARVWARRD